MMNDAELTQEDKEKTYSKYLFREMGRPAKEVLDFLSKKKVMDASLAMLPENANMNTILDPGYTNCEYGYCTLHNGGGYVAMLNRMPGVTFEMYLFWKKWWSDAPDSNLRYRIWHPHSHYRAGYRWSSEDFGNGPEDLIFIDTITPKGLGLEETRVTPLTLLMADGCNVVSKCTSADPLSAPVPGVVCHFVRNMPDGTGIELRSRFWKGYQIGPEGFYNAMGLDTPRETEESLYQLAEHNAWEMANLASFLPELYEEEKHTVGTLDAALTPPGVGKRS